MIGVFFTFREPVVTSSEHVLILRMLTFQFITHTAISFLEPALPLSSERETDALEKSKTGTTKSWFRFDCACVRLVENGGDSSVSFCFRLPFEKVRES